MVAETRTCFTEGQNKVSYVMDAHEIEKSEGMDSELGRMIP